MNAPRWLGAMLFALVLVVVCQLAHRGLDLRQWGFDPALLTAWVVTTLAIVWRGHRRERPREQRL